jgi:hypothetical protein
MKNLNDLIKKTIKKEVQTKSKNVLESMKTYNDLKNRGLIKDDKYNLMGIGILETKNFYTNN